MSPRVIIALQIWSALGPLVGIGLGAYLARSWQRKQWTLESKKTEYRELIGTLSRSVQRIIHSVPIPYQEQSIEEQREILAANADARSVIDDRIFIYDKLRNANLTEQWRSIGAETNIALILERWKTLQEFLVNAAHEELAIKLKLK